MKLFFSAKHTTKTLGEKVNFIGDVMLNPFMTETIII